MAVKYFGYKLAVSRERAAEIYKPVLSSRLRSVNLKHPALEQLLRTAAINCLYHNPLGVIMAHLNEYLCLVGRVKVFTLLIPSLYKG